MKYCKLTKKFQTTIPKEIRDKLNLSENDIDYDYLKFIEKTLTEWNSKEDNKTFKHLQKSIS